MARDEVRARARVLFPLLAVTLVLAACGGTAIVDAAGAGGGGASSSSTSSGTTSTSTSGTTATTTTGPCACAGDLDCPQVDDGCFGYVCQACQCIQSPLPPGTPCLGGVCDGAESCVECIGDQGCPAGEACIDQQCVGTISAICGEVCPWIEACFGGTSGCVDGCAQDLMDCSAAQLASIDACTDFLSSDCNVDAWIGCMQMVGCIEI